MKTYIIAEAACTHQGDILTAYRLIDIAAASGVDCVKFQIFRPDLIPNISRSERKYLDKCVLTVEQFGKLIKYCDNRIDFLLTPFDIPSVQGIVDLGLDTIKIPSGRLFDTDYIAAIKSTGKKLIISTGMCDFEEIRLNKRHFPKEAKWLHCTSSYPCEYKDLNLNVFKGTMFDGLSDHTLSTSVPAIAVAMGATIIEKHFTLSRGLPGPDAKVSLEPTELFDMVHNIREVETMLGDGKKKVEESEKEMLYRRVN